MKKNLVYDKAFKFSIRIVNLYRYLCKEEQEYMLSKQIIRSGTSIAANIKEATQAQSKKDFLNKMNIALKEVAETEYWLDLLAATDFIPEKSFESIHDECDELSKILSAIVKTTKKNIAKDSPN